MKKIIVSIALVTFGAFLFNAGTVNAQDAVTKGATSTTIEKTTTTKMCCKDPSVPCTGPCKEKKDCKGEGKCGSDGKKCEASKNCEKNKEVKAGGCSSTCKGMGSGSNTKEVKMCIKDSKTKCTNCNASCSGYTKSETKSGCPKATGSGCPKAAGSGCQHGKSN